MHDVLRRVAFPDKLCLDLPRPLLTVRAGKALHLEPTPGELHRLVLRQTPERVRCAADVPEPRRYKDPVDDPLLDFRTFRARQRGRP
jgi:hypothetical protein